MPPVHNNIIFSGKYISFFVQGYFATASQLLLFKTVVYATALKHQIFKLFKILVENPEGGINITAVKTFLLK